MVTRLKPTPRLLPEPPANEEVYLTLGCATRTWSEGLLTINALAFTIATGLSAIRTLARIVGRADSFGGCCG